MTEQPPQEMAIQGATAPETQPGFAAPAEAGNSETIPLPPLPPAAPPTIGPWSGFDMLLFAMLAVLAFFLGSYTVTNSDFWQHLATGRSIAQGTHEFGVDPYSFASAADGAPVRWVNHSWLYDVVLYAVYTWLGEAAVPIMQGLLLVALLVVLVQIRARDTGRLATLIFAAMALLVVSLRVPVNSVLVSYVLLAAMCMLLWRGGVLGGLAVDEAPSRRALWSVPPMLVLWVNLDAWFMLGLVLLVACVLGHVLGSFLLARRDTDLRTPVLAGAASVAACLLNPYHVHALTLPPELAYFIGDWLPASLGTGGQALRGFRDDPDLGNFFAGPFATLWNNFTIISGAYFALLFVSALSCVLMLTNASRPEGPGLPLGRLLLWLLVTLLTIQQTRLVPLFAVVAGPVTALNFADFARWWRSRPGWDPANAFNPNLARFASFMLALIALGLAWPGWLHANIGMPSVRHVAWQIQADPSLRAAAESVAQANAKHVFNLSLDFASYCAWFAPGVRCYMDTRFGLFAHETNRYAKAKLELQADAREVFGRHRRPAGSGWEKLFRERQVDHLAMGRLPDEQQNTVIAMCWLQPRHWVQRYADGRAAAFSWSPDGTAQPVDLGLSLNREAFGHVPPERRPPPDGAPPPQGELPLKEVYLETTPFFPSPHTTAAMIRLFYFDVVRFHWNWPGTYRSAWTVAAFLAPAGLGSTVPATVTGPMSMGPAIVPIPENAQARDPGPPAALLLAIREARRAVHERPYDAQAQKLIYRACRTQTEIEGAWITRESGNVPRTNRALIRHVQIAAALQNYLDLKPDDWNTRLEMAEMLERNHHFDAALEHYALAAKSLEKTRRSLRDKKDQESLKGVERKLGEYIKQADRGLKRRRSDYELKTTRADAQRKFHTAVIEPYRMLDATNKEDIDYQGMGLTLEGLKQLQIALENTKGDEKTQIHALRARFLLQLGRVGEASAELFAIADEPQAQEGILWLSAALGRYAAMDEVFAQHDGFLDRAVPLAAQREKFRNAAAALMTLHAMGRLSALAGAGMLNTATRTYADTHEGFWQPASARASGRALRGIFALEAGDTAKAEEHFSEALRFAIPYYLFAERPIAERYLELLRAQKSP